MKRFTVFFFSFALFAAAAALPASADDKADVTAVAMAYIQAFNAGDTRAMANLGAPASQSVIDDFSPHYWNGPNALLNWYTAFLASIKHDGITDVHATLSPSAFTMVEGDHAYAPLPMQYAFKINGTPGQESGFLTFAFEKVETGWRILGWTWTRAK